MSAPDTYGAENALNVVTFRRKLDHDHVVTIVRGSGTHVTYQMADGVEATLPRSTFEADFRAQSAPDGEAYLLTEAIADLSAGCVDIVSPSSSAGAP